MIRVVGEVAILNFLGEIDQLFKADVVTVKEIVHLEDLECHILKRMDAKDLIAGESIELSLVELLNSTIKIGSVHVCQICLL